MEEFFKSYNNTFQALSAVATALTVIISLWLARREAEKLSARLGVYVIVGAGTQDNVVNIYTKNIGLKTAYIPVFCFWFKVPLRKTSYTVNPDRTAAIELVPGRSEQIKLTTVPSFHSEFKRVFGEDIKHFRWLRLNLLKGYISTESGNVYRVKFDASFKKQLKKLISEL